MDTTTETEVAKVTQAPANVEIRVARRIEIGTIRQQGDVYLVRVAADHPRGKPLGTRQVAVGAHVGARHVAEGDGVEVFAGVTLPPGVALPTWAREAGLTERDMLGPVVVATEAWCLTHPEHAHHQSQAGVDQVCYQLDYSTRQRVVD